MEVAKKLRGDFLGGGARSTARKCSSGVGIEGKAEGTEDGLAEGTEDGLAECAELVKEMGRGIVQASGEIMSGGLGVEVDVVVTPAGRLLALGWSFFVLITISSCDCNTRFEPDHVLQGPTLVRPMMPLSRVCHRRYGKSCGVKQRERLEPRNFEFAFMILRQLPEGISSQTSASPSARRRS